MTTAHETSDAFSDETLMEQEVFQHGKKAELKETLNNLADGQIEMYKAVSCRFIQSHSLFLMLYFLQSMEEWERIIPIIQRIRVDV